MSSLLFEVHEDVQFSGIFKCAFNRQHMITNAEQRNSLRQSRLERQRECNKEQLNRQMQGKLGLLEAGRLTDEEGKLKDSLSLSKPMCPP